MGHTQGNGIQLRNCLYSIGLCARLRSIFLIANWCRLDQCSVGSSIPRQMGLGCARKMDEQGRGRESLPLSSTLGFPQCRLQSVR